MDNRVKYEKNAKVFFSAVVVLWIISAVLVITNYRYLWATAAGFAEAGFGSHNNGTPFVAIVRDPFVWLELVALLTILAGVFSKRDILVSIGAIIAIVIYVLNATGFTFALLRLSKENGFGRMIWYFWHSRRRLIFERPLIYTNIILLILYYTMLLIASKKHHNLNILRVGTFSLAIIITIIHCIDSNIWGWRTHGFYSYYIIPLGLSIVRGICFALAPFFYIGSKEKRLISRNVPSQFNSINTVDNLMKLKELLDKGIITQEEFESKKKEMIKG